MSDAQEAMENDLDRRMLTPAESAIWHLYHAVAKHRLPSDCTGAEWWVQVRTDATREKKEAEDCTAFLGLRGRRGVGVSLRQGRGRVQVPSGHEAPLSVFHPLPDGLGRGSTATRQGTLALNLENGWLWAQRAPSSWTRDSMRRRAQPIQNRLRTASSFRRPPASTVSSTEPWATAS